MFEGLGSDLVVFQELKIQAKDLTDDIVLVPGWDCFFSLPRTKKGEFCDYLSLAVLYAEKTDGTLDGAHAGRDNQCMNRSEFAMCCLLSAVFFRAIDPLVAWAPKTEIVIHA